MDRVPGPRRDDSPSPAFGPDGCPRRPVCPGEGRPGRAGTAAPCPDSALVVPVQPGRRNAGPPVRRSRSEILGQAASLRRSGELDPASEVPGQIAAFCDALLQQRVSDGLQVGWATMLAGAGRRDGPVWSLDLAVALLSIEEVTLRLDALVSAADCWRLYLRAAPGWYSYGEPDEDGGRSVREVSVSAEDDHGGAYISELGGDRHLRRRARERIDHEEQVLRFRPRLDPLAGALHPDLPRSRRGNPRQPRSRLTARTHSGQGGDSQWLDVKSELHLAFQHGVICLRGAPRPEIPPLAPGGPTLGYNRQFRQRHVALFHHVY